MSTAANESTALFHSSPAGNHLSSSSAYGTNAVTLNEKRHTRFSRRWNILMAMGVVFLGCVVFVFSRASIAVLQARENSQDLDCSSCPPMTQGNGAMSCSFGQMGHAMVVPVYQSMMQDIHKLFPDTRSTVLPENIMEPSDVESLRKTVLRVRDLMDVFSPIFPNRSFISYTRQPHRELDAIHERRSNMLEKVDVWSILRAQLDAGYTIIGQYQDLDHSHINYTMQLYHHLQWQVLLWKTRFMENGTTMILSVNENSIPISESVRNYDVFLQFLLMSQDIHHGRKISGFSHHMESRLFWMGAEELPYMEDCACISLQRLIQKQLRLTRHYLQRASIHESVLNDTEHTDFHNLRKILRCWINEYDLLSSFCDGSPKRLAIFPKNQTIYDAFNKARQLLGSLNDDWNAYTYYSQRVHVTSEDNRTAHATINQCRQKVDVAWNAFQNWSNTTDFMGMINSMLQA